MKSYKGYNQIFRETFRSPASIAKNGGVVVGTPTIDYGVKLNGTTDYIKYQSGDLNVGTGNFSVIFKIKSDGTDNLDVVVSKRNNFAATDVGWLIFIGASGGIRTEYADGSSESSMADDSAVVIDGKVHHIVFSFDRSGNCVRYIDGVASGSVSLMSGVTGSYSSNTPLVVGTTGDLLLTRVFSGTVSDLQLVKTALTAEEAKDLYEQDTVQELFRPLIDLPLRSWYYNGSSEAVTENKGSLKGTAKLGDGSTTTTFPTFLSPHGVKNTLNTTYLLKDAVLANGAYSVMFLASPITTINQILLDARTGSGVGFAWFNGSGEWAASSGTPYIDGIQTNVVKKGIHSYCISGITLTATQLKLLASYTLGTKADGNYYNIKIFKGTLTPTQVRIESDKLRKGLTI